MQIFENLVSFENRAKLEEYLKGYKYKTSGLSFSALYMWRDINQFSWQEIGDYLCVAGVSHLELEQGRFEYFMFPPVSKDGKYDSQRVRETVLKAKKIFEEKGSQFSMRLVPFGILEELQRAFPKEFSFIEDRPNYDYLYLKQDLIELAGKAYHGKKNHLNHFKNEYEYEYVTLTADMADDVMEFIDRFNKEKNIPEYEMVLLKNEEVAMRDVFDNIDKAGYFGGAIKIEGRIEAVSVGGLLGKNTVTVHIEKANKHIRGLYQAINNEFCKAMPNNIKYMNREEDMGLLNLRKAKFSYKPIELVEKYIVELRDVE